MKAFRFPPLAAVFLGLAYCFVPALARADTVQDAQRLFNLGQYQQALERTEQVLTGQPKDAKTRFLKGLILTEMNRQNEAIAVFTKLTEDYPELPEPYNNLAVIYAQQHQYEKAKTALEMAIRTHPSYATAHENLGDIYARLASQAYDKALQLDSSNTAAQHKLAMIRELMTVSSHPPASKNSVAPAKAAVVATAAPVAASTPKAQAPTSMAAQTRATSETGEPKIEAKPAADATAESEVSKAVQEWAAAWSRKDVKAYLAFYANDFQTPGGQPRGAWEKERQRRIAKAGKIEVYLENVKVSLENGERAAAKFRQHYQSRGLKTSSGKTLVLVRRDGRWQIQQERADN